MTRPSLFLSVLALAFAAPLQAQSGTLDAAFGNGGIAVSDLGSTVATGVAIDGAGRLVTAGLFDMIGYGRGALVARHTSGGALDASFADNGRYTRVDTSRDYRNEGGPVVVLADGSYFSAEAASFGPSRVYRVLANGTRTCFTTVSDRLTIEGMATTPSGDVVLAASRAGVEYGRTIDVMRVQIDYQGGACRLDPTFGVGGTVSIVVPGAQRAAAADVAVQPDGRLVVAGVIRTDSTTYASTRAVALRLLVDGTLDPAFGLDGAGYVDLGIDGAGYHAANAVALAPDGAIVIGGAIGAGPWKPLVYRLQFNGLPDPTFGTGGHVVVQTGDEVYAAAWDIAVDAQRRIVLVGPAGNVWLLARLSALDGAPDLSFGVHGITITAPLGLQGYVHALSIQPDGDILVAGAVKRDVGFFYALARYHGSEEDTAVEEGGTHAFASARVLPDPADNTSRLVVRLGSTGPVRAELYDLLGRHVARLTDAVQPAGEATIPLDLGGVPAGVYVLRVETASGVVSRPLAVRGE